MRQWALRGAEQRLLEIAQEAAAIHAAFPELRQAGARGQMPRRGRPAAAAELTADAPQRGRRRRRRRLSAEARKRISDAQKARWAKQRAKGPKR
jgi:hypothetical protein